MNVDYTNIFLRKTYVQHIDFLDVHILDGLPGYYEGEKFLRLDEYSLGRIVVHAGDDTTWHRFPREDDTHYIQYDNRCYDSISILEYLEDLPSSRIINTRDSRQILRDEQISYQSSIGFSYASSEAALRAVVFTHLANQHKREVVTPLSIMKNGGPPLTKEHKNYVSVIPPYPGDEVNPYLDDSSSEASEEEEWITIRVSSSYEADLEYLSRNAPPVVVPVLDNSDYLVQVEPCSDHSPALSILVEGPETSLSLLPAPRILDRNDDYCYFSDVGSDFSHLYSPRAFHSGENFSSFQSSILQKASIYRLVSVLGCSLDRISEWLTRIKAENLFGPIQFFSLVHSDGFSISSSDLASFQIFDSRWKDFPDIRLLDSIWDIDPGWFYDNDMSINPKKQFSTFMSFSENCATTFSLDLFSRFLNGSDFPRRSCRDRFDKLYSARFKDVSFEHLSRIDYRLVLEIVCCNSFLSYKLHFINKNFSSRFPSLWNSPEVFFISLRRLCYGGRPPKIVHPSVLSFLGSSGSSNSLLTSYYNQRVSGYCLFLPRLRSCEDLSCQYCCCHPRPFSLAEISEYVVPSDYGD